MLKLINNKTGETVTFEPDENGVITIPVGEWRLKQTVVIPEEMATRILGKVHSGKIRNNVFTETD